MAVFLFKSDVLCNFLFPSVALDSLYPSFFDLIIFYYYFCYFDLVSVFWLYSWSLWYFSFTYCILIFSYSDNSFPPFFRSYKVLNIVSQAVYPDDHTLYVIWSFNSEFDLPCKPCIYSNIWDNTFKVFGWPGLANYGHLSLLGHILHTNYYGTANTALRDLEAVITDLLSLDYTLNEIKYTLVLDKDSLRNHIWAS